MKLQGGQLLGGRAAGLAESDGGTSQCHGCPAQFRPQNQADAQMETAMCQKGLAGWKASDTRGTADIYPRAKPSRSLLCLPSHYLEFETDPSRAGLWGYGGHPQPYQISHSCCTV